MKPKLEGLEIIYPEQAGASLELSIDPGDEHVIILRRNSNQCKYSTQYMTHNRRLTVLEMKELARMSDDKQQLRGLEAFFKLYNSNQGTVFYFENPSDTQTVTIDFNLELTNLAIAGSDQTSSQFRVVLAPLSTLYKVLLPIERTKSTSIKMGYAFNVDRK